MGGTRGNLNYNAAMALDWDKADVLARQVIDLAKATVLSENHFLSAAVGRLEMVPVGDAETGAPASEGSTQGEALATGEESSAGAACGVAGAVGEAGRCGNERGGGGSAQVSAQGETPVRDAFAVDGRFLYYDTAAVLQDYRASKKAPAHDLLHAVMHCVFLHPYVGAAINQPLWDLACDMATERAVMDCCGIRPGERGLSAQAILHRVELDLGCRPTAEKIYHRLCEGKWASEVERWGKLFHADNHGAWYAFDSDDSEDEADSLPGECSEGQCSEGQKGSAQGNPSGAGAASGEVDAGAADEVRENPERSQGNAAGDAQVVYETEQQGRGLRQVSSAGTWTNQRAAWNALRKSPSELRKQQDEWRGVAAGLAVNLQTFAKKKGQDLTGLVDDLNQAAHQRVDYAAFLRQFATPGEVMRLSEDEFDYIFYTYGLKLYGNVPLIEPLEYREEKRIREFVLVIDTSGSVQGDTVRRFVTTTFDILKSTESFHQKVQVHVIQADAQVRSDDVITSSDELKTWANHATIHGGGGTDFRPAFEYVNALVNDGAFTDLGGLVYFTDGWGTYPENMPDYCVAFVFYDEDYRPESVPSWAAQVVLDGDALEEERKRHEHPAGN